MECYLFCQQYKDHFATAGATGQNWVPFATTFLKDRALYRRQQHKRKIEGTTTRPITWEEFKACLRRSLGESWAFVDTIWNKIRRASQYQLEEVMDWAAHLEHLQSILKEFDPSAVPNEETLIRYFRDGLRPSIRAQLDERGRHLDNWEEAIEKAVDPEAKAARQPTSRTKEIDSRCARGHRPMRSEDSERDVEAKKPPPPSPANPSYDSRNTG